MLNPRQQRQAARAHQLVIAKLFGGAKLLAFSEWQVRAEKQAHHLVVAQTGGLAKAIVRQIDSSGRQDVAPGLPVVAHRVDQGAVEVP